MKRFLCALLAALMLLSLSPAALAVEDETTEPDVIERKISSARELASFTRACARESYSYGVRFVLTGDIDLADSGVELESAGYFAGEFDGGGHTIRGLAITVAGSRLGLFRQVGPNASVHDLNVEGSVLPTGTRTEIGGIVGFNEGTIRNCGFSGEVRGVQDVGGVVGKNAGTVTGCRFSGAAAGEHQVGGVIGTNTGVVFNCENEGAVNNEEIIPGGERRFDLSAFSQEDFVDLSNIGGVVGENTGALRFCRCSGAVGYPYAGYNVGGIAGKNSGFVDSCRFTGAVEGRRDVGGVVGQSIPYAAWELSEDKLEELARAIAALSGMLGAAAKKVDDASEDVTAALHAMSGSSSQALGAISQLLTANADQTSHYLEGITVDPETGEITLPDFDPGAADTTALTTALNNLFAQSVVLTGKMDGVIGDAAEDLKDITGQMGYVFNLLFSLIRDISAGDLISTRDLSLEEAYDHDEGAIARCENRGSVHGETNVGGIVGTLAFELSFDMEDTLGSSNFLPTEAERILFAAVRACENRGRVESRADGAGGIAGRMDAGAVVDCVSAGAVASQNGDYVGGVAGVCQGSLSRCWSRCSLAGGKYIGGIAGSGKTIADCRAWTHIGRGTEYRGAVAGWADGEVKGNLYADSWPEGVDGVSRIGQAEALTKTELLALEGVPDDLETVTVRFLADGEVVRTLRIPFGGAVESLPAVENRGSAYWVWDSVDLGHVYADTDVTGRYLAPAHTLSSGEDIPQFLVEGEFYDDQSLEVLPFTAQGETGETLAGYTLRVDGFAGTLTVRMRSESGAVILLRGADGGYTEATSEWDGRYLVFALENGGSFAVTQRPERPDLRLYAALGATALLALLLIVRAASKRRKTRRKGAKKTAKSAQKETN